MVKENNNEQGTSEVVKENRPRTCFFVTPIGSENSSDFKKMTAILNNVINPVISEFGYESVVASDIQKIGSIGDQVFEAIKDSSLVISNLTGLNPNVMYETAVAHSFAKPTIMIMERSDKENLPFDLLGDRAVFFDNTIEGTGKLIEDLSMKIEHMQENDQVDNPVIRVMKQAATLQSIDGDESLQAQMYRMLVEIQERQIPVSNSNRENLDTKKLQYIVAFENEISYELIRKLKSELLRKNEFLISVRSSPDNMRLSITAVHPKKYSSENDLSIIVKVIKSIVKDIPFHLSLSQL